MEILFSLFCYFVVCVFVLAALGVLINTFFYLLIFIGVILYIFLPSGFGYDTPTNMKQYDPGYKNKKSNHQHSGPDFREVYTKRDEILKRRNGGGWF